LPPSPETVSLPPLGEKHVGAGAAGLGVVGVAGRLDGDRDGAGVLPVRDGDSQNGRAGASGHRGRGQGARLAGAAEDQVAVGVGDQRRIARLGADRQGPAALSTSRTVRLIVPERSLAPQLPPPATVSVGASLTGVTVSAAAGIRPDLLSCRAGCSASASLTYEEACARHRWRVPERYTHGAGEGR
jgi:hypothetical protein